MHFHIQLISEESKSTTGSEKCAEAKLRLAIEHTKKTISASPGAATCSVESSKDGVDYTGSINHIRFDIVVNTVYQAVASALSALLADAGVDAHNIDEIVYVGGTTRLLGLDNCICSSGEFREEIETPFARGTFVEGGIGDPTTILACGSAFRAASISLISDSEAELLEAFSRETKMNEVKATTCTLGVLFPNNLQEGKDVGGTWIPVIQKVTALPARRMVPFDVELTDDSKRIAFDV